MSEKAMTLRLDCAMGDELAAIAKAEGVSVSQVIRDAITAHVNRRKADPEFQRRVAEIAARWREFAEECAPKFYGASA